MPFAEDREIAAVVAFEHALDAGVSCGSKMRRIESVARRKTVMHPLAHGFVLRRHQAGRLRASKTQRVLVSGGVKIQ